MVHVREVVIKSYLFTLEFHLQDQMGPLERNMFRSFQHLGNGMHNVHVLCRIQVSDGEIYSGAELTSWTFQWDLTL